MFLKYNMRGRVRKIVDCVDELMYRYCGFGEWNIRRAEIIVANSLSRFPRTWGITYSSALINLRGRELGMRVSLPGSYFFSYKGALKTAREIQEYYCKKGMDMKIVEEAA